jgi:hypothetical protein
VEGVAFHSHRVELALIPYVTAMSLRQPNDVQEVNIFSFKVVLGKFNHDK